MNPILAIVLANIIWGAAPPIFKFALTEIPPFTLAFIRFFFAALIFLPMLKGKRRMNGAAFKNILIGSFWGIMVNIPFFFFGLRLAPSINVHVLSSVGPIALYLLSMVMLKERPHPQIIKGILVSFFGVLMIIVAPLFVQTASTEVPKYTFYSQLIGNLFFLASMLGAVLHTIYNKRALKQTDPYTVTFWSFMFSSLAFAPLMVYELQTWSLANLELRSWTGIIYGIFFSSALAYYFHNLALSKLTAQKIGVFAYLESPVAVLVAVPLLQEYPDMFFIIGSILVFMGIYLSQRHPHFKKMPKN